MPTETKANNISLHGIQALNEILATLKLESAIAENAKESAVVFRLRYAARWLKGAIDLIQGTETNLQDIFNLRTPITHGITTLLPPMSHADTVKAKVAAYLNKNQ